MIELDALAEAECQVWWAGPDPDLHGLLDLLDDGEKARFDRFRRDEDRFRYLVGHAMVRLVLASHTGRDPRDLRFATDCLHCGGPHGKPRLDPPAGLDFSLTHSGERVGLAVVRDVPVGLDVEAHARNVEQSLVDHVLSDAERRVFDTVPTEARATAFFTYWTRKEAVLKATGHGLAAGVATVEVSGPDEPARLVRWTAKQALDSPVRLYDLHPGPGHSASVALLTSRQHRVLERDAEPLLKQAL
ncbi:4'-phosphopantetheinyl transferase [Longimycelium tulufanense]|uniref:4'-phosphopantetheinyl transferase n=1 Tax=Longimycelium tulufanense TaxID=907463 RepID=A0A8J3C770_9PSEU|nr:4'-phosphopantetheinyl transferase superfamily protein [Longimycelium tulufanense]GGM33242.1 4'-phosphopantetheinyl transferase [Longimycelium tulufanense]